MTGKQGTLSNDPLKSIVPPEFAGEFREWARDGGYDESHFSKVDTTVRTASDQSQLKSPFLAAIA